MKMTEFALLIIVVFSFFGVSDGQLTSEEPANVQLPSCKWMTLNRSQVVFEGNSRVFLTLGTLNGAFPVTNVTDDEVSVCAPLSPQLLQCASQLRLVPVDDFTLLVNGSISNTSDQSVIGVRDYYVTEDRAHYVVCSLRIVDSKDRCSNDVYTRDEYRFEDPFNDSLVILTTNKRLHWPNYTELENGSIELCYPHALDLINCDTLESSVAVDVEIRSDHKAHFLRSGCQKYYPPLEPGHYVRIGENVAHCASPEEKAFNYRIIQTAFHFVSAGSLFLAILFHLFIPSLNYHAKPLMCHMTTTMVMYLCLGSRPLLGDIGPVSCYTLFVFTYVSVIASFLWLNVLAFDLWLLFSRMNTTRRFRLKKLTEMSPRKLFVFYSIYCWTVPALLSIYVVILDQVPEMQAFLGLYPRIHAFCWFNEFRSQMVCLFVPLFGIVVINFVLFVWTVKNLKSAGKGTEVVNKKVKKQLLFVCIRLFIVMGLCWFIEAIIMPLCIGANVYYIPNSLSALQGFIIFIVYICKPNTVILVKRKLTFTSSTSSGGTRTTSFTSLTKSLSNGCGNGTRRNGVGQPPESPPPPLPEDEEVKYKTIN